MSPSCIVFEPFTKKITHSIVHLRSQRFSVLFATLEPWVIRSIGSSDQCWVQITTSYLPHMSIDRHHVVLIQRKQGDTVSHFWTNSWKCAECHSNIISILKLSQRCQILFTTLFLQADQLFLPSKFTDVTYTSNSATVAAM